MAKHVLDLFSGLGGFSAAFEDADGWEVTTVDTEERFDPDVVADVLELRPTDFDTDYDVVLAGHPCTIFTTANLGYHLTESGEPKTDTARDHLCMIHHTIGLIRGLDPDYWFLENPRGRLRTILDRPKGTVWYCQYGEPYAKPTDLWGNHPTTFEYRSCSYGNVSCDHTKTKSYKEHGGGSDNRQGILAENDSSERAKVPYELSKSIVDAVEQDTPKAEQAPIDQFS